MNKSTIKNFIVVLVIIVSVLAIIFVANKIANNKEEEIIEHYEANQYIPVYVNNERMAKIYLADYVNKLYINIDEAYNLLDKEKTNFNTIEDFKDYISSLNLTTIGSKFNVKIDNEYKIFEITDKNNNKYIFETKGVLEYKVYFE